VGDLVADGFDLAVRFGEPPIGTFGRAQAHGIPRHHGRFARLYQGARQPQASAEVESRDCIDFYDAANRAHEWAVRSGEDTAQDEVLPLRVKGRLLVLGLRAL